MKIDLRSTLSKEAILRRFTEEDTEWVQVPSSAKATKVVPPPGVDPRTPGWEQLPGVTEISIDKEVMKFLRKEVAVVAVADCTVTETRIQKIDSGGLVAP